MLRACAPTLPGSAEKSSPTRNSLVSFSRFLVSATASTMKSLSRRALSLHHEHFLRRLLALRTLLLQISGYTLCRGLKEMYLDGAMLYFTGGELVFRLIQ